MPPRRVDLLTLAVEVSPCAPVKNVLKLRRARRLLAGVVMAVEGFDVGLAVMVGA